MQRTNSILLLLCFLMSPSITHFALCLLPLKHRRLESDSYQPVCRADEVIDSMAEDFGKRVKEITGGRGAYSALDALGGDETTKVHSCWLSSWSSSTGYRRVGALLRRRHRQTTAALRELSHTC